MTQPDAIRSRGDNSAETIFIAADHINQPGLDAELQQWVRYAVDRTGTRILALDLSAVLQLGSLGLNRLIQLNRLARKEGLQVTLTNVHPTVSEILNLTRLERLFEAPPPDSVRCPNDTGH